MKKLLLVFAALFLSAAATFGDELCNPDAFRPDGRKSCFAAEAGVLKAAFDIGLAQEGAKVDAARRRYWALYRKSPNSPGIAQAYRDYMDALRQKDAFYLAMSTSMTMNIVFVKAGNALAALSGDTSVKDLDKIPDTLDGGIRPYARPLFARWIAALRRQEDKTPPTGDPLVDGSQALIQFAAKYLNDPSANPRLLVDAMRDKSNFRAAYEDARNWAELLASGVDISGMNPDLYIRSQMEADVSWTLGLDKPDKLPEPADSANLLYQTFVKLFLPQPVFDAAQATLKAPKNSVGGLATRYPVEVGEFVQSPSPNPYYLFLSKLTKSSPRAYAIALAFNPNTLMTMQPAAAFSMRSNWEDAFTVYNQLVAKYGEKNVEDAAKRLSDIPKDSEGRIAGDPQSQPLRVWFQALLKDRNAAIPDGQIAHFLASSYDPRWTGKSVIVRGTVARVDVDTRGIPQYATIRFKDTRPNGFAAFSPYPDMLQSSYGGNFAGLIGKTIEVQGDVQIFGEGAGVRILSMRQLKVLDAGAPANFRESTPDWLKLSAPGGNLVDSPKYLAWKKFPPGSKASYDNSVLHEYQSGTNQYTETKISHDTLTLVSIDGERAKVKAESTVSGKIAGRNGPDTTSSDELIFQAKQAAPGAPVDDPRRIVTSGEETLTINGKKIATRWECVTRAGDPMTFTKTWTSDDVPGGLVRTQQQSHTQITGQTYRDIRQTLLAPIDGVEAQLGDATSAAPSPAGTRNLPASRGIPGGPAQPAPALGAAGQPNVMAHYSAVTRRANIATVGLAQAQRRASVSGTGVPVPDDIRAAQERLTKQQQAANLAIRTRDYTAAEPSLRAMEDTLAVIEDFLAKAGTPLRR